MDRAAFSKLKPWIVVTDVGMLVYWAVTAAKALGWLNIPGEWLFSDYDNPVVVAWNWSFLPLDLLFSACGLGAAWLHGRGRAGWRPLAIASLFFTWCAGFMAISFWAIRLEFDPFWWGMNGFLMAWPMAFAWAWVPSLTRDRSGVR